MPMYKSIPLVLSFCLLPLAGAQADPDPHEAFRQLLDHLSDSEAYLRNSPFYEGDADQAAAYMHLARMLIKAVEQEMLQDADFPFFRVLDFNIREGGDNPDQRYLFSPIRGGQEYRIWGRRGSAARVEIQLYAGEPWAGTGASAGYLGTEDIEFNDDGTFEVLLTAHPREAREGGAGTRLDNPASATTVMVRQIYPDWNAADPGDIHIDRVGFEGKIKPLMTTEEVARRLARTGEVAEQSIRVWPDFVQQRYIDRGPANILSTPLDTSRYGGVPGRWMSSGHFDIPEGYALLVKTWPVDAKYQGIQLADRWFASLEYANRISSLTTVQSHQSEDGAFYYIVSAEDPGYINWLDTAGLRKGLLLLRFDGVPGEISKASWPQARLVRQEQLAELVPDFRAHQVDDRAEQIRARRKHVQIRFHR